MINKDLEVDEALEEKALQEYDHNSDYTLFSGISSTLIKSLRLSDILAAQLTSPP